MGLIDKLSVFLNVAYKLPLYFITEIFSGGALSFSARRIMRQADTVADAHLLPIKHTNTRTHARTRPERPYRVASKVSEATGDPIGEQREPHTCTTERRVSGPEAVVVHSSGHDQGLGVSGD